MKVALIGARGIPASYSGFETCAENLGARLVVRGHAVTIYNRAHHIPYRESVYKGMRLVRVRGIATNHLDTITHTALSMLHALTQNYDAMVVFIASNAPLCVIPRLFSHARVVWGRCRGAPARRCVEPVWPRTAQIRAVCRPAGS